MSLSDLLASPAERKERALARQRERLEDERVACEDLPIIDVIRQQMLKLSALGVDDPRLTSARQNLATLADDFTHFIARPAPKEQEVTNADTTGAVAPGRS